MSVRDVYQEKLQAQLDEWSADINKLKAEAHKAKNDVQLEYYKEIEDLNARKVAARAKLAELKEASDDVYRDMIGNMENMRESIDYSMKSAITRFKTAL
jgi:septal ring factor EnvC (AmiA/AmiB activator)